jgi:hypothetical protein
MHLTVCDRERIVHLFKHIVALTVRLAAAEVPAFLVGLGALCNFHHKGRVRSDEVVEELEVEGRAQVVRVADKYVLDALREELIKEARAEEGRVDVAVARGAPAQLAGGGS